MCPCVYFLLSSHRWGLCWWKFSTVLIPILGVEWVAKTTAHLHSVATNVKCLTWLHRPCWVTQKMKVFPCLDQRMTPSVALCTPQNRELFPASFLFRTESLVSHSVTISLFPQPRHLTRERFNDAIYIHWILIGLNSNAVSTFWITAINVNVITCQF